MQAVHKKQKILLKNCPVSFASLLIIFSLAIIPLASTLWSETLNLGGSILTGKWTTPPGQSGTTLSAEKSAEGYTERTENGFIFGVRGEICATNGGERPTEELAILDTVQYKSGPGQFQDYFSAEVDVSEKPVLEPGESYCYIYDFPFEPLEGEKVKYRNTVSVTIQNHSGWLPGGNHCEGPEPCPFGPNPKAEFSLPESIIPSTQLSATQSTTGFTEDKKDAGVYYGAKGEVCVENTGEFATEGMGIYAIVENQAGKRYVEKASRSLNTKGYPVLAPGEIHCYYFEISFPDPDENVTEPRVMTTVTISNHTDWMPGDASCPGPDACYYGPTVESYFDIPVNETLPSSVAIETPETGTSISATKTATGFIEEHEEETVYGVRGDICVTNNGLNTTEGLSITDIVQFKAEGDEEFSELKSVNIDLGTTIALTATETQCYPYEILFNPQTGEAIQYRNIAEIKINNHVYWLPGSTNCPGEEACPFGANAIIDFSLTLDPVPTEPPATETPVTETPATEPPVTETPATEPPATEHPATETPATEPPATEPPVTETPATEPPATEPPATELPETESPEAE